MTANTAYDALNRVSTLQDASSNTLATFSYDSLNRVTGVALANGTTMTPSYDLLNRLTSLDNALASVNRNYGYTYDNASRITSVTEPRGTISTSYDNRNEVTGITEPSGSPFSDQSFTFDAGFNRASWTLGSTTTDYTANNLNQYTAVGSTTPTWNSDGGLATFDGNTYTYDALGRLTQASNSLGIYVFSYDPFGRRVKKVDENPSGEVLATTTYHYDGSSVAVEYQPSTTWTYYGGVMRTDGTNKQWYYRDGQGSVSAVTDNSGNVLEAYEYTSQGHFQITNGSGTDITATGTAIGNNLLFAGYRYDAETGNYFCNARYYNPKLGRFISRDPLSGAEFSQGTNLYAYCGNDPVNATDPSGMDDEHSGPFYYGGPATAAGTNFAGGAGWYIWNGIESAGGYELVSKSGPDHPPGPPSAQISTTGPQDTTDPDDSWNADVVLGKFGITDMVSGLDAARSGLIAMGSFAIFPEGEGANLIRIAASEKKALAIGKQIARDLGRQAQRDFHDMKLPGAPDRTLEELKADAQSLYEDAGMTPPSWLQ